MPVRVVRFTDVSAERMDAIKDRVAESEGPPPGVPATGMQMLYDAEQGTVLVLQHYASDDDLRTGEKVFEAMDSDETPGVRASVDRCATVIDVSL